jgi:hypothetical protein
MSALRQNPTPLPATHPANDLPDDGLFAHGRHAQIARRVNLSQAARLAQDPKSTSHSQRPVPTRGALRDRHERWVRDAVDALATQDERC